MSNVVATVKSAVKLSAADKAKHKAYVAKLQAKRAEALKAKANKSIEATLARLTTNEAMHKYVQSQGQMQGLARVMYHKIADETGMRDWPTLTAANARGNERAVWDKLEELRKIVWKAADERGLVNKDKPWSDIKAIWKKTNPDSVRREAKALESRQKAALIALYKAGMKEQRPTEGELGVNAEIGRILHAAFKVDLSTLG